MTSTSPNSVARAARIGLLAALASAGLAVGLVASTGAAHIDPPAPAPPRQTTTGMHGDPVAAAPYWRYQQQNFDCGEMAVADVIGQISGHEPPEDEITGAAENIPSVVHPGPIYRGGYTSNKDLPVLLNHYGIQADAILTNTATLMRRLDQGRKVIVGLNNKVLWNTPGDRSQENHFVVVTGIDTKDKKVHVNDSGIAAGRNAQVSIATFEAAWATSDNFAVVTR